MVAAKKNGEANKVASNVTDADLKNRFLKKREEREVDKIFRALVKLEGSDLHLKVGRPPIVRIKGALAPLNRGPIDVDEMVSLLFPMLDERNRRIFDEEGGADFAYTIDVDGVTWRFRVNMLQQRGAASDSEDLILAKVNRPFFDRGLRSCTRTKLLDEAVKCSAPTMR